METKLIRGWRNRGSNKRIPQIEPFGDTSDDITKIMNASGL